MIGITNSGTGGISANKALLIVYTPLGSTVTAISGSVSKKSKQGIALSDRPTVEIHLLSVQSGIWTVTATRGIDTNSTTINITEVTKYELYIGYHVPISEYQEVEFLQSSGTQYINPNFITNQSFKVNVKFQSVGFKSGNNIWGKQGYPEESQGYPTGMYTEQDGVLMAPNSGTSYDSESNTGFQFVIGTDYTAEYYYAKDGTAYVSLDGNVLKTYAATTRNSVNRSMFIFATNNVSRSGDEANYFGKYKIYYWHLRDSNGVMQREMYPCYRLSDSKAGMYDRVNGVFYPGQGSGTFTVGADVS